MVRPVRVEPRPGYRIWLEYSDGVAGEVDLSDMAGRGVFRAWNELGYFDRVHITPHQSIAWDEEIEICPDAMYMELTGKTFEELLAHEESLTEAQPALGDA